MRAHIRGTGACLPGDPLTNDDLERLVGGLPEGVLEGIGVVRRHWLADPTTAAHRTSNTEMAYAAARQALEAARVPIADVELLVAATSSPEYLLPPTASLVQEKLGLERCATLDVRGGSAAAIQALDVARLYVERGIYRTALVVGSEAISPLLVPLFRGREPESLRLRDRLVAYNFADGAGAVVLQASDGPGGILGATSACIGGLKRPGAMVVGGGTHAPLHEQLAARRPVELRVDVVEAGAFLPHVLTAGLRAVLEATGVAAEGVNLCLIPEGQADYLLTELRRSGLWGPEWEALAGQVWSNLPVVGATGSAAVPLALDAAVREGRLTRGQRVLLLASETSKWIHAGMVVDWDA